MDIRTNAPGLRLSAEEGALRLRLEGASGCREPFGRRLEEARGKMGKGMTSNIRLLIFLSVCFPPMANS